GRITGARFTGFYFGIFIGGVVAAKIGSGKLGTSGFPPHVTPPVGAFDPPQAMANETISQLPFRRTFRLAVPEANLEPGADPLVATIFPRNRPHYLHLLHASWPAGLVLGGAAVCLLDARLEVPWKWQLALYLVPVLLYGLMFLGQPMPKSEASKRGLSIG